MELDTLSVLPKESSLGALLFFPFEFPVSSDTACANTLCSCSFLACRRNFCRVEEDRFFGRVALVVEVEFEVDVLFILQLRRKEDVAPPI